MDRSIHVRFDRNSLFFLRHFKAFCVPDLQQGKILERAHHSQLRIEMASGLNNRVRVSAVYNLRSTSIA